MSCLRTLLVRLLALTGAPLLAGCGPSPAPPSAPGVGGAGGQSGAGGADGGDQDETSCAADGVAERCYGAEAGAACLPPYDPAITDTSIGALLGGCQTPQSEYCARDVLSGPVPGPGGCCYRSSCTCCSSPFGRPLLVGGVARLARLARGGAWSGAG